MMKKMMKKSIKTCSYSMHCIYLINFFNISYIQFFFLISKSKNGVPFHWEEYFELGTYALSDIS